MVGVKKPVNIFRLKDLSEPREVFNWHLWLAVASFGLMGIARGIDEGLISGSFNSTDFQKYIHFDSYSKDEQTNIKGNVTAMVQIGSVGGALISFLICDRIGRIWATRQLCILWILGIAIFVGNGGKLSAIYAGRFIAGLGIGQTVVVAPVYLAEIAPASIRGICTCVFTGFTYIGIVLAYFSNYGCQIHMGENTHKRWLVPTSLHIIFAGLILFLSLFQQESPRFLIKRNQFEKAASTLATLRNLPRNHEFVVAEVNDIQASHEAEMEASTGAGPIGVLREAFKPTNFYRLYLSCGGQILSHWSGAGSITVYAPDLIKLLGFTGTNQNLLLTAIFGIVKLVAAILCTLFLVDYIGRKRSLLIGITLQAISMVYVAGFLTGVPEIGAEEGFSLSESQKRASEGALAMFYISGFGWALGWNSMQYLLTAELFPLRIRALATSAAMTLHFANQYGMSRAVPNMLTPAVEGGISPHGTFWFFAAMTIIGGIWVWFSIPETAGRTLESMDRLFDLPWYRIGLHGNADADRHDGELHSKIEMSNQGLAQHVERAHV